MPCDFRKMFDLVRMMSAPLSQNCPKDRSGCLREGRTVAVVACLGRLGWRWPRFKSAVWEAIMVEPLGVVTTMGLFVFCLLVHGVSAHIKWLVHPESAQPE